MSFQKSRLRPTRDLTALARRTPDWSSNLQLLHLNGFIYLDLLRLWSQDIDRPLRLEITPLAKVALILFYFRSNHLTSLPSRGTSSLSCCQGGGKSTIGGMTITTGTVIPTPQEAGWDTQVPHWLSPSIPVSHLFHVSTRQNLARLGAAGRWPTRTTADWRLGWV